jgi:acyl carrier protein
VLGVPDARGIPSGAGLFELGMDSLMSVELRRRLERASGRRLPSTLTFNFPNVDALAGFLDRELAGAARPPVPPPAASPSPAPPPPPPSADLDALSDEALEARLRARIGRAP